MGKGRRINLALGNDIVIDEDIPSGPYEVEKLDSPVNYSISKVAYKYPDVYPTEFYVEYDDSTDKIADIAKSDVINIAIKSKE